MPGQSHRRDMADLKVTEPTMAKVQILRALNCETVIDKKYIKKVLKKLKNWCSTEMFLARDLKPLLCLVLEKFYAKLGL